MAATAMQILSRAILAPTAEAKGAVAVGPRNSRIWVGSQKQASEEQVYNGIALITDHLWGLCMLDLPGGHNVLQLLLYQEQCACVS